MTHALEHGQSDDLKQEVGFTSGATALPKEKIIGHVIVENKQEAAALETSSLILPQELQCRQQMQTEPHPASTSARERQKQNEKARFTNP